MAQPRKFGKAQVEVTIRDRVSAGLVAIQRKMTRFGAGVAAIGSGVAGVGTRVAGVGAAMTGAFTGLGALLIYPTKLAAEIEQVEVAFSVMLGSMAAAKDMIGDLREFAVRTPLQFAGLASASNMLLQYGFTAEEILPTLKMLGDVSGGNQDRLDLLARALGQVRGNTRLMGQEVLQMINSGFNPLQEIARTTGRSMQSLRDDMEAGLLSYQMVANAFRTATSEGGRFNGMLKNQSHTLAGLWSTLKDNIALSLIPLGQAASEVFKPILKILNLLATPIQEFMAANKGIAKAFIMISAVGVVVSTAVTVAGMAMIGLGATIASTAVVSATLIGAIGTAIALIANPVAIVIGAVLALGGYIAYVALTEIKSLAILKDMFGQLSKTAVDAWGGIVAAIANGNLQLAGQIAFTALKIAYLTVMDRMRAAWDEVVFFLTSVWLNAVKYIIDTGAMIYFGVAGYFDQLTTALTNGFDTAGTYILGAIDAIQTKIAKVTVDLMRFFRLLSAEDAAGAKTILDQDLAQRAGNRQSGLGARFGQRAARDQARRNAEGQFGDIVGQDLKPRRAQRDQSELDAAAARLAELNENLAAAIAAAKDPAAKTDAAGNLAAQLPDLLAQTGQQGVQTKAIGTSSAAAVAAGVFGAGSNRSAEDTAKNTAETAKYLRTLTRRPQAGFA